MRAHGTVSCYTGGCRREECRAAFREYHREWRKRRRKVGLPIRQRQREVRVRPPRVVAPPTMSGAVAFEARTDPLVLQAIRRVFNGHQCVESTGRNERRCPHMPTREREALDAWLEPRVAALVEILAGEREREVA